MKNLINIIIEGKNDFHPKSTMGKRKSKHSIDDKKPAKTARASIKHRPDSAKARFGSSGHSSYWD